MYPRNSALFLLIEINGMIRSVLQKYIRDVGTRERKYATRNVKFQNVIGDLDPLTFPHPHNRPQQLEPVEKIFSTLYLRQANGKYLCK